MTPTWQTGFLNQALPKRQCLQSAKFTRVPIRFWIMIGKASFEAYFKKSFLFSIHGFSLVLSTHSQLYHTLAL